MWPLIAIGAGLLFLTGAARGAQAIQVNPQGAAARVLNGTPAIIVNFRIFNPGIIAARINTIAGQVLLEGNQIGSIEFAQPTTIPPRGQVVIGVPIKLTVGILPTLIQILKGNMKGYQVNANGTAFTTAGAINFNNTIELT